VKDEFGQVSVHRVRTPFGALQAHWLHCFPKVCFTRKPKVALADEGEEVCESETCLALAKDADERFVQMPFWRLKNGAG
jgi:hypothetical protein